MRPILIVLICALFSVAPAWGEASLPDEWGNSAPPVFRHVTPADGLPYPVVLGVVQDKAGFIWVATPGGAGRWDGYRVADYRHDDNNPDSIPENILTNALTDEIGRVWFSTASGILTRYDDDTDSFVSYRRPEGSLGRPNGMAHDGNGGILVAARQGLFRLEAKTGRWSQIKGLPDGEISSVLMDRQGRLWVGTGKGLFWRAGGSGTFFPVLSPTQAKLAAVSALYQDSLGRIWFGTRFGRVGRISLERAMMEVEQALPASGYRVTAFTELASGALWISEYGGGIREFSPETKSIRSFTHDPAIANGLADNAVTGLLRDRSGLLWASSLRGLHRYIPNNRQIITIVEDDKGLPGKDVRSVAAAADGKAWLGFRDAVGLATLDPYTSTVDRGPSGRQPKSYPRGLIQAIADSGDGRLWVGQQSGLTVVDIEHGTAEAYAPLVGQNILALQPVGEFLWVGGAMGLAKIPLNGGEPQIFRTQLDDDRSLSDNTVSALFHDAAGRLWVGTMRGLNRMDDVQQGRFTRFLNDPTNAESLPSDIINAITQDHFGMLWFATGNGIARLNPDAEGTLAFTRFGTKDGLRTGTVLSVIEAANGSILAGTGDGLAVIERPTMAVKMLGPTSGVEITTFWAGAAARLKDGSVVFGGFGGLVLVRPHPLPVWNYDAPVVITGLRVGSRRYPATDEITLQPGDGGIQIEFAALDYAAPERQHYSYRLDAGEWVSADVHQRTATYTNLPPGTHHLTIRATNSAGVWSTKPLQMTITVLPEWHQTNLFRLALLGGIAALVLSIFQVRKARHLRRERELTQEVAIRTHEAEAAKLRALAGEEEARRAKEIAEAADLAKSRFLAIIGHEIRTPLNGLLGMLHLMEPDDVKASAHSLLATAKDAGETLRSLVESVLEFGRQGVEASEPVLSHVDVNDLVRQITDLLRPQAEAKNLYLHAAFTSAGPTVITSDQAGLSRILLNLVGNAIKFTDDGGIDLQAALVQREAGYLLTISVNDTGIGVPEGMQDAIFSEFTQADDSITRRYGGVGLGLAICRRLAIRMGGDLTVQPAAQAGSSFILELPVTLGGASAEIPPIEGIFSQGSLRILVVDDDAINLRVAERMLTRLGHQASSVNSGKAALAAVHGASFDLILMDLRMPDMDGLEACRQIKRRTTGVRVVAMTAEYADQVWQDCLQAGMDNRLLKPITLERLAKVLSGHSVPSDLPRSSSLIDRDYLEQQIDILGPDEMRYLVRIFGRATRANLRRLQTAVDVLDRQAVQAISHQLRSSAGPLGLTDFAEHARQLEKDAQTAERDTLLTLLQTVKQARMLGLQALKAFARG